jgi:hypothetical protein
VPDKGGSPGPKILLIKLIFKPLCIIYPDKPIITLFRFLLSTLSGQKANQSLNKYNEIIFKELGYFSYRLEFNS